MIDRGVSLQQAASSERPLPHAGINETGPLVALPKVTSAVADRGCRAFRHHVILMVLLGAMWSAGEAAAQSDRFSEDWRWVSYGAEAERQLTRVTDILETTTHDIWAVTETGLFRFNGFFWQGATGMGLPPGVATAAPLDSGSDELLVVVDGHSFVGGPDGFRETTAIGARTLPAPLESVAPIFDGSILLTTTEGAWQFQASTGNLRAVIPPQEDAVVFAVGGGVFAHNSGGLRFRIGDEWIRIPPHGIVYSPLASVTADRALFGLRSSDAATRGVWEWTTRSGVRPHAGHNMRVNALALSADGTALVTHSTGTVHLRTNGIWQEIQRPPAPLADATVLRFATTGDLWTATPDGVHLYPSNEGLWSRQPIVGNVEVQSILRAADGSTWVGAEDGLTVIHADGRRETFRDIDGVALEVVTGLAEDRDGIIWVSSGATFRGVFRRDGSSWRHLGTEDGFPPINIHRIVLGRDGLLWFMAMDNDRPFDQLTNRSGVWYRDDNGVHPLATTDGRPLGRAYDMAEGTDGVLWFATLGGLHRLADGDWTHWTIANGLATDRVFTVTVDDTDRPWFGHQATGGGLGTVGPDDSIIYYTTANGLLSDEVNQIAVGEAGVLWITTDRGLVRMEGGVFSSFDRSTGLRHRQLWPVAVSDDGIWVGSMGGGVFLLQPEKASGYPPVVTAHQPVVSEKLVVQPWFANAFRGEIPSRAVLARHRIDDGPWSEWSTATAGGSRSLFGINLAAGNHRFYVQTRDRFGHVGEPTPLPMFRVSPPAYRHPIVIGLVSAWLVTMIVLAIVLLRKRKTQLREVRDRERHFRSLIENATDLITVLAEDGTILYESPSSRRLLGSPPKGLQGQQALDFVHGEDRPGVEARLAEAFANPGVTHSMEFRFRHYDGHWIDIESVGRVNPEHQSPRRIILNSRDITQRKSAERALEELQAELRHAHKMDALGTMAGGIAHDFNNILTAIMGYAEIMRDRLQGEPESRSDLEQILAATRRARDLVSQILTFSRRSDAATRPVRPEAILKEAEKLLRASIPTTIDIEVRTDPDAGTINADPGQIHQVLMNLGTNAAQAMKDGGGKLTIAVEAVTVDAEILRQVPGLDRGPHVRITVADTGIGMAPEVLPLIYDPFFTTKKVGEGTGLGLSVVHGIVTNHGGRIAVESTPAAGSAFHIYLPRIPDASSAEEPSQEETPRGAERVLIVDDEPQIAELSATMLNNLGYHTTVCGSSAEAAELLAGAGHEFDLVVTDYTMPTMTGLELTQRIRDAGSSVPVIIMTGYGQDIGADRLTQLGIHHILMKPFKTAELGLAVRAAIEGAAPSAATR